MTVDVLKRARLETAIWAAKLLLLCVGTVSTLVFFKAAIIPYLLNLTVSIVPQLWTSFKSCFFLSPLYIYIILNFIIITIAASSTCQRQRQNQKQHQQPSSSSSSSFVAFSAFISDNAAKTADNIDSDSNYIYSPDNNSSIQSQSYSQQQQQQPTIQSHSKEDATALLFSPSSHDNRRHSNNEMMSCPDIHIVQADDDQQAAAAEDDDDEDQGFGPSPEMRFSDLLTKSVEMRRPEVEVGEHINTLDTTWKAIMEGQGKAIGKHLKKSDTWDTPPRLTQLALRRTKFKGVLEHQLQLHHSNLDGDDDDDGHGEDDAVTWARRELKKSDTFSDRVSLRREKSMTQEELNQRAEAFIKKFNNDIRLQRLESDQRRFKEIVNRGL